MPRKTIIQSISFQQDIWNYLQDKKNISALVDEAIREYKLKRETPELKIRLLKEAKRDLIKKVNEIDEEIKEIQDTLF